LVERFGLNSTNVHIKNLPFDKKSSTRSVEEDFMTFYSIVIKRFTDLK